MIHIATVHWQTDKWISVQQSYFRKHLRSPYRIYAWLNEVPPQPADTFYYSCVEPLNSHPVKLNLLAQMVYLSPHRDDDVLIFIDGDAFPIGDIEHLLKEKLSEHKLIAVQRLENNGDIQPHPCFCATTVGFWREINGDWKAGYDWKNKDGKPVTDVGGNLLRQLNQRQVEWYPLLRSNKRNLHPVLFGIYENVIYHHAAGFRPAGTRADGRGLKMRFLNKIVSNVPRRFKPALRQRFFGKMIAHNNSMSERIFQKITEDTHFYREFV
jgi:hypothetical protein